MRRLLTAVGFASVILAAYLAGKTDATVIREPASCPIPALWVPVVIPESQPENNRDEAPPAQVPKKKPPKPKAQPAVWKPDRDVLFGGK